MKKFYIMLLALILALAMIVPMTIPVSADNPPDKKPVSWVTAASNGNKVFGPSISMALVVKQLSDGTTAGHLESHVFPLKQTHVCVDFISSSFYDSTAEFEGNFYCKQTETTQRQKWVLVDNGEPGMYNDYMEVYNWNGAGYDLLWGADIVSGNIQVHVGN